MNLFHALVLVAFLPVAVAAQEGAPPAAAGSPATAPVDATMTDVVTAGIGPFSADGLALADLLWVRRPLVVFADTPNDPAFQRQMQRISANIAELERRDVIVITDTDPAARTAIRQKLRPRGFSLVIMDKDGEVKRRNPAPWDVREITNAIDRFPLRRQEMLELSPSGR